MPELPDIELYLHALRHTILGEKLTGVVIRSPSLLRTFEPDAESAIDHAVTDVRRMGKRIVWEFGGGPLCYVFHLMIAGRFHKRKPGVLPKAKNQLAAFHFPKLTLLLTEMSQQKRATLHVESSGDAVSRHDRGGLDLLQCSLAEFNERLDRKNRTIKRALTDPSLFDGVGNAYSDEILHAARVSPIKWTSRLDAEERERIWQACKTVLHVWKERLIEQHQNRFPTKVTAFRPEMAVHGKFNEPCPACGAPVQRIVYAANECNYCAGCQTEGKVLADRSLSRLLKDDWPRSLEGWSSDEA